MLALSCPESRAADPCSVRDHSFPANWSETCGFKPRFGAWCVCWYSCEFRVAAHAATISVPAGGDLQAALDAAKPGDVITLEPGATYVGNFVLTNKGRRPTTSPFARRRPTPAAAGRRPHDAGVCGAAAEDPIGEQHLGAADARPRTTGSCCSWSSRRTTPATATSSRSAPATRRRPCSRRCRTRW